VAYMAPEQIEGRPGPPSDQYSLGIMVYEWLTGAWPFLGSVRDIVAQHLVTAPPALRDKAPHLSEAIEPEVQRALAKKPQQRFASVLDFASALEDAIAPAQANDVKSAPIVSTNSKVTPNLLPPYLDVTSAADLARFTPDHLLKAESRQGDSGAPVSSARTP